MTVDVLEGFPAWVQGQPTVTAISTLRDMVSVLEWPVIASPCRTEAIVFQGARKASGRSLACLRV